MVKHPESSMWQAVGGDLKNISTYTAFEAAAGGDEAATMVIESYLDDLSVGVTNLINIFQPDMLCVGGGLAARGDEILVPLRSRVDEQVFSRDSSVNTIIKQAELGNEAGLIGAANLGKVKAL
jgi:glucokinase